MIIMVHTNIRIMNNVNELESVIENILNTYQVVIFKVNNINHLVLMTQEKYDSIIQFSKE